MLTVAVEAGAESSDERTLGRSTGSVPDQEPAEVPAMSLVFADGATYAGCVCLATEHLLAVVDELQVQVGVVLEHDVVLPRVCCVLCDG